jgi:hypothetical protein
LGLHGHVFNLKTDLRVKIGNKFTKLSSPAQEIQEFFIKIKKFWNIVKFSFLTNRYRRYFSRKIARMTLWGQGEEVFALGR